MQPHPVKIKRLSDLSEWCDASKSVQQIGVHDLQASTTHSIAVLSNSRTVGFGRDVFVWGINTRGVLLNYNLLILFSNLIGVMEKEWQQLPLFGVQRLDMVVKRLVVDCQ